MNHFINYIYVITSTGFIVNTLLLLFTTQSIYNTYAYRFPISTKKYLIFASVIILAIITLKLILIIFFNTDKIVTNTYVSYYYNHINLKIAILILIINPILLFIEFMGTFAIYDIFDDVG